MSLKPEWSPIRAIYPSGNGKIVAQFADQIIETHTLSRNILENRLDELADLGSPVMEDKTKQTQPTMERKELRQPQGGTGTRRMINSQPARLLIVTTVCVFVAEALIMMLLRLLPDLDPWMTGLLDATMIVVLVLPVLYLSLFRPIERSMLAREQVEQSLRTSESKFRSYVDSSPYAIIVVDNDRSIIDVNDASVGISGYAKEELLTMNLSQFFPPEERTMGIEHFARVVKTGRSSGVVPITIEGGAKRYWEIKAVALGDNRFLGFIDDVTEHNQTKEELEKYRLLFAKANDMAYICDANGIVLYVNETFERFSGHKVEEFIGKDFAPLFDEENLAIAQEHFLRTLQGETPRFELSFKDTGVLCEYSNVPMRDEDGTIVGVFGLATDITDRRMAEEALRESEEKYHSIFDLANEAIIIIDEFGTIHGANHEATKIYGYSHDEFLGINSRQLIHPDYYQLFVDFSKASAEQDRLSGEVLNIHKDGRPIHVRISVARMAYMGKSCFVNLITDITEVKRLQEQESRAERLETVGTIAGQVAHDFNNLLAPLLAYPDFIREELPSDHPGLAYLDDIEDSAAKIAEINQQLLSLGRRGHYNQKVVNLNEIVQQAAKELHPLADGLTCVMELDTDLMNILGGSSQIHRVVTNLLCNAVDALQSVGHVLVKTENFYVDDVSGAYDRVPMGEYVKLTISDTGVGISEDIVQQILDPFFTTKTSDKKRGSGLGLSVVDAVVKDHGGYMDLETRVGKGTSFFIYLPITRRSPEPEQPSELIGGNERVLVIDDDDMQRKVCTKLLGSLGYTSTAVESGEQALELLKEKPQDLLILDMVMPPGMDGTETYRRIQQINPTQKAIIVSGFSESDRVRRAQELGAGPFVRKPLKLGTLAAAVRKELDQQTEVTVASNV